MCIMRKELGCLLKESSFHDLQVLFSLQTHDTFVIKVVSFCNKQFFVSTTYSVVLESLTNCYMVTTSIAFLRTFKYVSCGDYGYWAIRTNTDSIAFLTGVTFNNPQGTGWLDVDGSFVQLKKGLNSMQTYLKLYHIKNHYYMIFIVFSFVIIINVF